MTFTIHKAQKPKKKLGQILIEQKLITKEELKNTLKSQEDPNQNDQTIRILSQQIAIPLIKTLDALPCEKPFQFLLHSCQICVLCNNLIVIECYRSC